MYDPKRVDNIITKCKEVNPQNPAKALNDRAALAMYIVVGTLCIAIILSALFLGMTGTTIVGLVCFAISIVYGHLIEKLVKHIKEVLSQPVE